MWVKNGHNIESPPPPPQKSVKIVQIVTLKKHEKRSENGPTIRCADLHFESCTKPKKVKNVKKIVENGLQ